MDFSPILISLKTTAVTFLADFIVGIIAAWLVLRIRNRTVRRIVDVLLTLPLVLPPTVAGFFLLYLFGVKRPLGILIQNLFGTKVVFTWGATVIAAFTVSFPLMYRSVKAGFEQIDQALIDEAKVMGLGSFRILWLILVPCSMPAIICGSALSATRGLGEYGATAMLAGNIAGKTRTLPMAVYSEAAAGNFDRTWIYVGAILVIAFTAVIIMDLFADHAEIKL